jgi:8-hydroxy-5-deazaflavin:NADPH oxidoreductase
VLGAVADAFPGAAVVKAFNQLPAAVLARPLPAGAGKTVVLTASNSADAGKQVARIAEQLGYAPVDPGRVDEGGRLIQAREALVLRHFTERPLS